MHAVLLGEHGVLPDQIPEMGAELDAPDAEGQGAALDPFEIQEIVDEKAQPLTIAMRGFEKPSGGFRKILAMKAADQAQGAEDRGQGGAQFMAHHRHELVLQTLYPPLFGDLPADAEQALERTSGTLAATQFEEEDAHAALDLEVQLDLRLPLFAVERADDAAQLLPVSGREQAEQASKRTGRRKRRQPEKREQLPRKLHSPGAAGPPPVSHAGKALRLLELCLPATQCPFELRPFDRHQQGAAEQERVQAALGYVILGALPDRRAGEPEIVFTEAREDDHRNVRNEGAQSMDETDPLAVGKQEIEQNEIVSCGGQRLHRLVQARNPVDPETRVVAHELHGEARIGRVVLDQKQLERSFLSLRRPDAHRFRSLSRTVAASVMPRASEDLVNAAPGPVPGASWEMVAIPTIGPRLAWHSIGGFQWEGSMFCRMAAALSGLVLMAAPLAAAEFQPAIIFDTGGKFDKSFNEAAYNGAERFKKETGISYLEFEVTNESQRDQALRRMARKGADVVVAVGFAFATPLATVADEYPDTKFVIIDSVVDKPNVQGVVFKEHEGSFLVGIAAAMASRTGKVGFVGGMDIPLIRNFAYGYEQGIHYVNPDIELLVNMAGNTPAAWSDPAKGAELAISQFDRGADVVYAAAGATGLGVLQAAADKNKLAIGVDSNQNCIQPGHVLTSMLKRVDVAVYTAFKSAMDGTWKPGPQSLGLKENGVDYAYDECNKDLLTEEMRARMDDARTRIIAGDLVVEDYYSTQKQ